MKRFAIILLLCCLLPLCALADSAQEITFESRNGKILIDAAILCDGDAATGYAFKSGKAAALTITLPEGAEPAAMYFRLKTAPESVTIKQKNASGKWEAVTSISRPNAQFVLQVTEPLPSTFQLEITGVKKAAVTVQELRMFSQGDLPADVPAFLPDQTSDLLYVVPGEADLDMALLEQWHAQGRTVQVMVAVQPEDEAALADRLWAEGVSRYPITGGMAKDKPWNEADLTEAMVAAIRAAQAPAVLYGGEGAAQEQLSALLTAAAASASDYNVDLTSAAKHGLVVVSHLLVANSQEAADLVAQWEHPGTEPLRQYCIDQFADAMHGDVSTIPYPERDADGYLPEGEFLHEDKDNGLWAYVSPHPADSDRALRAAGHSPQLVRQRHQVQARS